MAEIEIRPARVADLGGVTESSNRLIAEDAAVHDRLWNKSWAERHGAAWIDGLHADDDALVLAAAADVDVVGHLIGLWYPESDRWLAGRAELISMEVVPARRGQGIGTRLVAAFTRWALDRSAARIQVSAFAANEDAIRFYRQRGFRPTSMQLSAEL